MTFRSALISAHTRPPAPPRGGLFALHSAWPRALATGAAAAAVVPAAAGARLSAAAPPAARVSAAALLALDVRGVVDFVESLGVSRAQAEKLAEHEVDGPALLELTEDALCSRCAMHLGPARAILRAVVEASTVTLRVFPPLRADGGGRNNPVTVRLTPATFVVKYVASGAPLQLVSSDGAVLLEVTTLAQAVEAGHHATAKLRWTRSFGDDVKDVRGFVDNAAEALEQATTRAMAGDAGLARDFGPLTAINAAESFTVSRCGGGKLLQMMQVDGLVVGARGALLLNSTKHTPSVRHVAEAAADARKLAGMLAKPPSSLSTKPAAVKACLLDGAHEPVVVPFLCGSNFSAAVEAACVAEGVGVVRPSGDGFAVEAPRALLGAPVAGR